MFGGKFLRVISRSSSRATSTTFRRVGKFNRIPDLVVTTCPKPETALTQPWNRLNIRETVRPTNYLQLYLRNVTTRINKRFLVYHVAAICNGKFARKSWTEGEFCVLQSLFLREERGGERSLDLLEKIGKMDEFQGEECEWGIQLLFETIINNWK